MSRRLMLIAFVLCCSGISTRVDAQQISETYRKVNPSVVIVRVQQKTTSSDPQKGQVSLPSFGSGVLISTDGKILTAAHVVQAADQISVEFFDAVRRRRGQRGSRLSYGPNCSGLFKSRAGENYEGSRLARRFC